MSIKVVGNVFKRVEEQRSSISICRYESHFVSLAYLNACPNACARDREARRRIILNLELHMKGDDDGLLEELLRFDKLAHSDDDEGTREIIDDEIEVDGYAIYNTITKDFTIASQLNKKIDMKGRASSTPHPPSFIFHSSFFISHLLFSLSTSQLHIYN